MTSLIFLCVWFLWLMLFVPRILHTSLHKAASAPDPNWPKPDYERIAQLEIDLQDGPAWDQLQQARSQEIQRRAKEQEAQSTREDQMAYLRDHNPEEFFRQIAYDTWQQDFEKRWGRCR